MPVGFRRKHGFRADPPSAGSGDVWQTVAGQKYYCQKCGLFRCICLHEDTGYVELGDGGRRAQCMSLEELDDDVTLCGG